MAVKSGPVKGCIDCADGVCTFHDYYAFEPRLFSMVGSCGHAFERTQLIVGVEEYCPRCGQKTTVLFASSWYKNTDHPHHKALPHKTSGEVHEGWDREKCVLCRKALRKLAVHPTWNGKPLLIGDVLSLTDLPASMLCQGSVTLSDIRINSYTGEVWMHCFEHSNLVLEMRHIGAVNGEPIHE